MVTPVHLGTASGEAVAGSRSFQVNQVDGGGVLPYHSGFVSK